MELTKEQLKKIPKLASGNPDLRSKAYRALKAAKRFAPEEVVPAGGVGFRGTYVPLETQMPNESQVGGTHYTNKVIQPWDYVLHNNLGYAEGNIVKYISRWKEKDGVQDLKKAQHYLAKLIEVAGG